MFNGIGPTGRTTPAGSSRTPVGSRVASTDDVSVVTLGRDTAGGAVHAARI